MKALPRSVKWNGTHQATAALSASDRNWIIAERVCLAGCPTTFSTIQLTEISNSATVDREGKIGRRCNGRMSGMWKNERRSGLAYTKSLVIVGRLLAASLAIGPSDNKWTETGEQVIH